MRAALAGEGRLVPKVPKGILLFGTTCFRSIAQWETLLDILAERALFFWKITDEGHADIFHLGFCEDSGPSSVIFPGGGAKGDTPVWHALGRSPFVGNYAEQTSRGRDRRE